MKWTMDCANVMKRYRAENHITQKELSERTGISQSCLCEMEQGRCKIVRHSNAMVLFSIMPELRELEEKEIEAMNKEVDAIKANMDAEIGLDAYKTIRVIVDGLIADIMAANIDANKKVDLYMKIIARMDAAGVLVGK